MNYVEKCDRLAQLVSQMEEILSCGRTLSTAEKRQFDEVEKEATKLHADILRAEGRTAPRAQSLADWKEILNQPRKRFTTSDQPGGGYQPEEMTSRFIDASGNPVHVLSPREKFTDLPTKSGERSLSLGKLIVGMATGNWRNAADEKLAMAEGQNSTGGFLFGDSFSRTVIDFARNRSAVIKAGGRTVTWENSDRLVMARVAADPVFEVKEENAELTERNLTFEQIGFTAHKIGCLISMSRELASDAPNAAEIVQETLGRALATELDRIALVGVQPNGLLNYTGIESTDSVGAILWEDIHNAAITVQNNNFDPTAYICSPTIGGDLDIICGGDGTNASKVWLGPPPSLNNIPRYTTKNCPDANLFVGDWTQFVFGLRQDAQLEMTTTGGDSFKKHQLLIKITWRGDVGCLNALAFHALRGITT